MQNKEYQILINDIKELLNNVCKDDRIKYHINPVVEIASNMSKELGANIQVVEISAYLHDITKMVGERKNHHITGAEYAEQFLKKYNIDKEFITKVKNCILKHRGSSEFIRNTLEEKIIATSDAVAHIEHPLTLFYAWYGRRQCSIDEGADGIISKLQRSWNKIEFEYIKEKDRDKYKNLLKILEER